LQHWGATWPVQKERWPPVLKKLIATWREARRQRYFDEGYNACAGLLLRGYSGDSRSFSRCIPSVPAGEGAWKAFDAGCDKAVVDHNKWVKKLRRDWA
jgi:hypothetical protein